MNNILYTGSGWNRSKGESKTKGVVLKEYSTEPMFFSAHDNMLTIKAKNINAIHFYSV